jgi:hypothetical protein
MGTPKSAETRAKMSAAQRGHPVSAETRRKLADARRGKSWTPAQRAALSTIMTEAARRPEFVAKQRANRIAWWTGLTPAERALVTTIRGKAQRDRWARLTTSERQQLMAPANAARRRSGAV